MGQSQSTAGSTQEPQPERKTDYYELLGLTRSATDDEIKKAYRKKALELHPDRNYGNVDEATRLFAEVQSAYEVLSDPQERAWYDSHSDAFLGGATSDDSEGGSNVYNIRITTAEEVLKVFSKFSPRMEFSDSPSGFFGGLRDQFVQLALEERAACQYENEEPVDYPGFGYQNSDFESTVRPFYAVWSGFSTRKSFAWKDAYRLSEAPDRRVRRLMEKENRRLREEGIRTFNDAVRSLVAFIKKRDPRWKLNAQNEAQRQEALRQSVAAQAARSRAMNIAKMKDHVLPEWARSEEQIQSDEESEESEIESFECVACNKSFKSQNQYDAHEKSKKHIKAVKQLTREMRMQDTELELDLGHQPGPELELEAEPEYEEDHEKNDDHELPEVDVSADVDNSRASSPTPSSSPEETNNPSPSHCRSSSTSTKPQDPIPTPSDSDSDSIDEDYAPRETIETRLHPSDPNTLTEPLSSMEINPDQPHPESESQSQSQPSPQQASIGKAKQKRAKRAAAKEQSQSQSQPAGNGDGFICSGCNADFPSKTKLFSHLQKFPGHAKLKSVTTTNGKSKGKSKR